MPRGRSRGSFIAGLIGGALAGAVAALLLAPKVGRESREIIRDKSGQYIGNVRDRLRRHRTEEEISESIDGEEPSTTLPESQTS